MEGLHKVVKRCISTLGSNRFTLEDLKLVMIALMREMQGCRLEFRWARKQKSHSAMHRKPRRDILLKACSLEAPVPRDFVRLWINFSELAGAPLTVQTEGTDLRLALPGTDPVNTVVVCACKQCIPGPDMTREKFVSPHLQKQIDTNGPLGPPAWEEYESDSSTSSDDSSQDSSTSSEEESGEEEEDRPPPYVLYPWGGREYLRDCQAGLKLSLWTSEAEVIPVVVVSCDGSEVALSSLEDDKLHPPAWLMVWRSDLEPPFAGAAQVAKRYSFPVRVVSF